MSGEMFVGLCQEGAPRLARVVQNGLPQDARFIGANADPRTLNVWLIVESREFDEVGENEILPEHPAVLFELVNR